jgi:hypothetical protein
LNQPVKRAHALAKAHETKNDLILTQRGLGCIKGYTGMYICFIRVLWLNLFLEGHNPTYTLSEPRERATGCDPRTTQGAAFGPERRIL